jgi:phospholipid/cholesterol/gamma-HCH transport system substrate-binding protein
MANRNFIVGLFVSVGLVALVSATIWLTGRNSGGRMAEYSLFFDKGVSGLTLGGPVYYLGVEVGNVSAMTIVPGDPTEVRVDIEILESTPIDSGTWATLALQGITGIAVIKLSGAPGHHEPLPKPKPGERPVITVRDTGFSALMSKAPQIIDRLDEVLAQIGELLSAENQARVSSALHDIAALSGALSEQRGEISRMPTEINDTMRELRGTVEQLRSTAGRAAPKLDVVLKNLEQTTASLEKMALRMESWGAGNDSDMNAFLRDGLGQVPALVADTRAALREFQKLVKDLRANPSKLIYQPPSDAIETEQ